MQVSNVHESDDILPKRFGLKYTPTPTIALEYSKATVSQEKCELVKMEFPEITNMSTADALLKKIQQTHREFSSSIVNETQLVRMLQMLIDNCAIKDTSTAELGEANRIGSVDAVVSTKGNPDEKDEQIESVHAAKSTPFSTKLILNKKQEESFDDESDDDDSGRKNAPAPPIALNSLDKSTVGKPSGLSSLPPVGGLKTIGGLGSLAPLKTKQPAYLSKHDSDEDASDNEPDIPLTSLKNETTLQKEDKPRQVDIDVEKKNEDKKESEKLNLSQSNDAEESIDEELSEDLDYFSNAESEEDSF